MPNPYRDSLQRFASRDGIVANIDRAIVEKDFDKYLAEREALENGDEFAGYTPAKDVKPVIHPALKNAEEEIIERDRLIAEGTREEITAYMEERLYRPEFEALLQERDEIRDVAKKLKAEYDLLKSGAKDNPDMDYEIVRQKGFELLEAYESLQVLKAQANSYKDITAPLAARLSEMLEEEARANGTFREYTEETLNDLVVTGDFPSGSREWLEQRQQGIGGSDVGKIIGVYKRSERDDILESKINPITDEEVEAQAAGHTTFEGATGRGNAWEQLIAHKFAENNPDARIAYCKSSWKNSKNEFQFANFDGLMLDKNGKPNGILEIKTASDASKWGNPEDGLDAVPPGYRAQALWYAHAAGFNKGAVAVMIDDREYREYHFKMTPELKAEAQKNFEQVKEFVKEVEAVKTGNAVEKTYTPRKGFPQYHITGIMKGNNDKAFQDAAVFREETVAKTRARFAKLCKDTSDPEAVKSALVQLYAEKDPATRKKPIIAIDLETSGNTPTSGRIIEVGISKRDPQSKTELEKYSKLYGLPRKALEGSGTGAVHVHGITEGKIAKKRQFSHPEVQKEVLQQLKSGIMVSHNAPFEISWLSQHLEGFANAYRKGEIQVMDTMDLTIRFMPETKNNKLESFCNAFGIEYVDAHRAHNDAAMMADGLAGFFQWLHKTNKGNS